MKDWEQLQRDIDAKIKLVREGWEMHVSDPLLGPEKRMELRRSIISDIDELRDLLAKMESLEHGISPPGGSK